ncbi:DMT family transporter [Tateyamaria sp. SN6-1]|uniref:DMT family transporter n=1 Tax=Tateyamaria sp. SN6-1 TaxID=3092148 RepID=UPI0039F4B128
MSVAILIWASWLVLTSSGVTTDLTPVDLAGLRALVPAVVLAPMLWRHRQDILQFGPSKILLLSLYGAPFTLCVGYGLSYAPVAHAGAMVPGLMPVVVTVVGFLALGQRLSAPLILSALLIVTGASAIVFRPSDTSSMEEIWIGHTLFLTGAVFWASFTLTVRRYAISPFLATALVGAVSAIGLTPIWVLSGLSSLGAASITDIAFQVFFQGVITGLVSLYAFGEALRRLGLVATRLSALTPAVATLLAVPILSQVPDRVEVAALGLVVVGLLIASMPMRRARSQVLHPVPQK